VYVTAVVPNGKILPGSWVVVSGSTLQLSVAMGGVQNAVASHEEFATIKMSLATQPEIEGAVSSITLTLNVQVCILPAMSVAVYTTTVVPKGKISPGSCELANVGVLQLSVAVGTDQ
jgi:hypothetical protein